MPDFKGYISDIGAPSANMYRMSGRNEELCKRCKRPSCLHPKLCPNMNNDHRPLLELYAKIRNIKGVKRAFIGSGIRYDLFDDSPYLATVVKHHTSGRLKVAPEHTEDHVLNLMRKPSFKLFEQLLAEVLAHESAPVEDGEAAYLAALGRFGEMADSSRRGTELLEQGAERFLCFCRGHDSGR